jgi:uncharacterized protein (TIGR02284 family)
MIPEVSHNKQQAVIDSLNQLIVACEDSEQVFRMVSETVTSDVLKTLFANYAEQRAQFAIALKAEVHRQGGKPKLSGSLTGAMHRGWMSIKAALTSGDEKALVSECLHSEETTIQAYADICRQTIPADVLSFVNRQYEGIVQVYNHIRTIANRLDLIS